MSSRPLLFTPGPLTTSATVKAAMLHDYGSRDAAFIALHLKTLTNEIDFNWDDIAPTVIDPTTKLPVPVPMTASRFVIVEPAWLRLV